MGQIDKDTFNKLKERMKAKFPILLEGYLRDAKTYLVTIETNLPDGNIAALIDAAHSLKSASGLLGIVNVAASADELEYAAKRLQTDAVEIHESLRPLYLDLQEAFSAIESDLKTELERAKAA